MNTQSCLGCGAPIILRQEGDLGTCLACGSSYIKKKERLEEVTDHRYLEPRCDEAQARSEAGEASQGEAELVFLPFWVIVGRFETRFTLSRFKESFFSVSRTLQNGTLEEETVISVPACRTEVALGLSLPLASSSRLYRCHTLAEGEVRPFSSEAFKAGRWYTGCKSRERAMTEANRFVHSRQRLAVEQKFSEVDISFEEGGEVRRVYLVHRPFWVLRGEDRTEVVDAHTGKLLVLERGEDISLTSSFQASRFFTLGRVAVGFVGAFMCLGPALLGTFLEETLRLALLVPTSLALLLFMRIFIFGLYSPYGLMANHPSLKKVGVFTPRLGLKGGDDPDVIFWACTIFLYLPLVGLPLLLLGMQLRTGEQLTVLGAAAMIHVFLEVGAVLPMIPALVVVWLFFSALKKYIFRSGKRSKEHSVMTARWFGIPALFVVAARALITLLIAIPMLAYAFLLNAELVIWPALKALFG